MRNQNLFLRGALIAAAAITLGACDDKVEIGPEAPECEVNSDCADGYVCEEFLCVEETVSEGVCGDGIVDAGEQCDEAGATATCTATCEAIQPAADFRVTKAEIISPTFSQSCSSVQIAVNAELGSRLSSVRPGTQEFYTNVTLSTEAFTAVDGAAVNGELAYPVCTKEPAVCTPVEGQVAQGMSAVFTAEGACLAAELPGLESAPAGLNAPTNDCIVAAIGEIEFDLHQFLLPMSQTVATGRITGEGADLKISEGVLQGFLSQADAAGIVVPAGYPIFGGLSLASFLEEEGCEEPVNQLVELEDGTKGWWVYANFEAKSVAFDRGDDNGDNGGDGGEEQP